MFQSKTYLEKHTGRYGSERASYLQMLVTEFQDTANGEFKEQILANLANFAYDPINYEWLRQLNVIDLFLDMLTEDREKLVEYAMAGICNLCCDRLNQDIIFNNNGVAAIKKCLSSNNEETVLSAITTLYFLVTPRNRADICTKGVLNAIQAYSHAPSMRLKNLAKVFMEQHGQPPKSQQQYQQQQYQNYPGYNQQGYDAAAYAQYYNNQQGYDAAAYTAAGYNYDPAAYAAYYGYSADAAGASGEDASASTPAVAPEAPEAPAAQ